MLLTRGGRDEGHRRSRLSARAVQHLFPSGHGPEEIGKVLDAIKPEVIYFTDNCVGRGAVMVVGLDSAGQPSYVTELLMLNFGASVHYRFAMSPAKLQSAGLDRCAAT
jgi:hypothetical protein